MSTKDDESTDLTVKSTNWVKSTDAEMAQSISICLEVIAGNGGKRECLKAIMAKHPHLKERAAYNHYLKALHALDEDLQEDIKSVRNKRIKSLQKDMMEAYNNYQLAEKDSDRNAWYKTYLDVKKMYDSYFPNALKPIEDTNTTKIELVYNKIEK